LRLLGGVEVVSAPVGHSSIAITFGLCSHATPAGACDAADQFAVATLGD